MMWVLVKIHFPTLPVGGFQFIAARYLWGSKVISFEYLKNVGKHVVGWSMATGEAADAGERGKGGLERRAVASVVCRPPPRGSVPRFTFAYLSCPYLFPHGHLPPPLFPDRGVIAPMCNVTNLDWLGVESEGECHLEWSFGGFIFWSYAPVGWNKPLVFIYLGIPVACNIDWRNLVRLAAAD